MTFLPGQPPLVREAGFRTPVAAALSVVWLSASGCAAWMQAAALVCLLVSLINALFWVFILPAARGLSPAVRLRLQSRRPPTAACAPPC